MEGSQKEIILLTGSTGFIGSHILILLAERCLDTYNLRIALRDLSQKTLEKFKEILGEDAYNQIEFVEAEMQDKQAVANAVRGVKYIVHSAGYSAGDAVTSKED